MRLFCGGETETAPTLVFVQLIGAIAARLISVILHVVRVCPPLHLPDKWGS